jgi:uncharacterized protein with WD repeat
MAGCSLREFNLVCDSIKSLYDFSNFEKISSENKELNTHTNTKTKNSANNKSVINKNNNHNSKLEQLESFENWKKRVRKEAKEKLEKLRFINSSA